MEENKRNKIFENKIKPILSYVGSIGAVILSICYIICIFVLIIGFKVNKNFSQSIVFAVITAIIGLMIMQFLKVQGISFAKSDPDNQKILAEYYNNKTKDKKPHSIKYFWATSLIKDFLIKGITVMFSTAGIIYIVIEGSNDWNLLLLAIVNLLMFICFGFLSLVSAYDFYNEKHIPYIKLQLENNKKEIENVRNTTEQSDSKT